MLVVMTVIQADAEHSFRPAISARQPRFPLLGRYDPAMVMTDNAVR
jgi:hypothetical protein